jgi:hypothetical protein
MCNHQFFKLDSIQKPAAHQSQSPRVDANMLAGALIMCAICGEVRHIFEDGTINIVRDGK